MKKLLKPRLLVSSDSIFITPFTYVFVSLFIYLRIQSLARAFVTVSVDTDLSFTVAFEVGTRNDVIFHYGAFELRSIWAAAAQASTNQRVGGFDSRPT